MNVQRPVVKVSTSVSEKDTVSHASPISRKSSRTVIFTSAHVSYQISNYSVPLLFIDVFATNVNQ